ncbi:MAG: RsmB/NOP family class I SAM-dependent RNA methyltransferase [Burkholderiaceae bacterium]|nr:RsmB/NOP family class I SAM-dependent RNA methyltransferase [Burkholderiaceae bacterium]
MKTKPIRAYKPADGGDHVDRPGPRKGRGYKSESTTHARTGARRPQRSFGESHPGSTSRITALVVDSLAAVLTIILKFDGPSDVLLSRFFRLHPALGQRDRGLIAEAVFSALRRYATLGWVMQPAHPLRAPRLAALVTLARDHGVDAMDERALRGDTAAVTRMLATDLVPAPATVRAELPEWLFTELERQYEDAEPLIDALKQGAPLDLRVNLIKATRPEVLEELAAHQVGAVATRYSPDAIRLSSKPALTMWPAYRDGRIEVQDEGSQLIARLLQPRRGEMVVDFCAGAGGKTLALGALMRSTGRLYAFDINEKRLAGLGPRLKRSGLSNVHPVVIRNESDIRVKRLNGKCDRVLVDAPCSGSGTLRRNPDLKWRFNETELARVNDVQRSVLKAAARLLKPGGRLVYATCSLLEQENQHVVDAFLAEHPNFELVAAATILRAQSVDVDLAARFAPYFVMLPHVHGTDGFFAAALERR